MITRYKRIILSRERELLVPILEYGASSKELLSEKIQSTMNELGEGAICIVDSYSEDADNGVFLQDCAIFNLIKGI